MVYQIRSRYHAILNYDPKVSQFYIIPFSKIYIDNQLYFGIENPEEVIIEFQNNKYSEKYGKNDIEFIHRINS